MGNDAIAMSMIRYGFSVMDVFELFGLEVLKPEMIGANTKYLCDQCKDQYYDDFFSECLI